MMTANNTAKKTKILTMLETGQDINLHINTTKPGVLIPEHLTKSAKVVLMVGLNCKLPINDLDVSDHGISATLSFNRQPKYVVLPWESLWAVNYYGEDGGFVLDEEPKQQDVTLKSKGHLRLVVSN